jgi:hypothetical protein
MVYTWYIPNIYLVGVPDVLVPDDLSPLNSDAGIKRYEGKEYQA